MKPRVQLFLIAAVMILILVGEAVTYLPQRSAQATVVIKSYPSTDALVQALSNGEVDVAPIENIAPQTLQQLKNDPNLNIVPIANFGFTYIGVNLRHSPLNNSVFREAMLYGFNRERVLNYALAGYGELLSPGLFSSAYGTLGWTNESIDSYPYDPAKASELLDSIGFNMSSTGVRVNPSTGQQLNTMFIFSKLTDPQAVAAGNMFAQDMQAIGLPIISFPETDIDFYSQVPVTYYFDLYVETVSTNAAPTWLYNLFSNSNNLYPAPLSTNLMGYDNSSFNTFAEQLMTASSLDDARAAALKCQEELSLDLPAFPVYSKSLLLVEQKGSVNLTPIAGSIAETLAASLANMTGGNVRIGVVGGLADINPAITLGTADSIAMRLMTTPLITYSPNGSPKPGLADQWQMSNNATDLTIDLGQGTDFQNGNPATAHDVAATLNWLIGNVVPSAPLYPVLKLVRTVSVIDPQTVSIILRQSDYFAPYELGSLFALPAAMLPQDNGPLALLLSGALQSSGPFELARFVQGAEADLQTAGAGGLSALFGVEGQDVAGYSMGGSQIELRSQPLTYEGETIENATFTAIIQTGNGTTQLPGSYIGYGVYAASLNLDGAGLSPGNLYIMTQAYGQLPTGAIVQFAEQNLFLQPPLFLGQVILYLLGLVAVVVLLVGARKREARARRRTRRRITVAARKTPRSLRGVRPRKSKRVTTRRD
ncbi:MAG TPA: ABC transporter substrate-binding protein [Candidatus Acidoferrales bacterium]|nr:ABC transporter substrate-binding protein [Candidatus Acidoferrales bacterium]